MTDTPNPGRDALGPDEIDDGVLAPLFVVDAAGERRPAYRMDADYVVTSAPEGLALPLTVTDGVHEFSALGVYAALEREVGDGEVLHALELPAGSTEAGPLADLPKEWGFDTTAGIRGPGGRGRYRDRPFWCWLFPQLPCC